MILQTETVVAKSIILYSLLQVRPLDVHRSNIQVHCGNNDLSVLLVAGTAAQENLGQYNNLIIYIGSNINILLWTERTHTYSVKCCLHSANIVRER